MTTTMTMMMFLTDATLGMAALETTTGRAEDSATMALMIWKV